MHRTYKRRFWLIAAVSLLLLVFVRSAHAAPQMCGITGTVYNIDGSVAANGSVMIRAIATQTFGADTVQVTPEYITLSNLGVLPGGVQVPLGSRIFIQVGRDKPVSVVAPTLIGNCPITFGALYGSALSSPPPATTIVTSIGATNNAAGLVLSTTNPAGAGPANIALATGGGPLNIPSGYQANSNALYDTGTPTLGACGTSPTIQTGSTNSVGEIQAGTGTTSCVINFSHSLGAHNVSCAFTADGQTSLITPSAKSSTTVTANCTVVNASSCAGFFFSYNCEGF